MQILYEPRLETYLLEKVGGTAVDVDEHITLQKAFQQGDRETYASLVAVSMIPASKLEHFKIVGLEEGTTEEHLNKLITNFFKKKGFTHSPIPGPGAGLYEHENDSIFVNSQTSLETNTLEVTVRNGI